MHLSLKNAQRLNKLTKVCKVPVGAVKARVSCWGENQNFKMIIAGHSLPGCPREKSPIISRSPITLGVGSPRFTRRELSIHI